MKKVENLKKLPSSELRERRKSHKLIYTVLIILILALAIVAFLIYRNYENQKFVKRGDIATYRWLKCIQACPTDFNATLNRSLLDPVCSNMCSNYLIAFGQDNYNKYAGYHDTLLNSTQVRLCVELLSYYDFKVFQECLNQTIPHLEQRYPYVVSKS